MQSQIPCRKLLSTAKPNFFCNLWNPATKCWPWNFHSLRNSDGIPVTREEPQNNVIRAFCSQKRLAEALALMNKIPDALHVNTYADLLQLCIDCKSLENGRRIHHHMSSSGLRSATAFLCNRLLDMYIKCGSFQDARQVFEKMPNPDTCSWNTIIAGCFKNRRMDEAQQMFYAMPDRDDFSWTIMVSGLAHAGLPSQALAVFRQMQIHGCEPSVFTISSALSACSSLMDLQSAKEIHAWISRKGFHNLDVFVWSSLLDAYAKCGSLDLACHVFEKMPEKDVVSWTVMIGRLVQRGNAGMALKIFGDMMHQSVRPNQYTFASVLGACAMDGALELGLQCHGFVIRNGILEADFVQSALIDMYAKCGNLRNAGVVFGGMRNPDLVSWSAMIAGCAQNGQAEEALRLFENMVGCGLRPDHVVFVHVLHACAHAGLVQQGRWYFEAMSKGFGLRPGSDHYTCMVRLLCRAGCFAEAQELLRNITCEPDEFLWSALLSACRTYGNVELAKWASDYLSKFEPENGEDICVA